MTLRVSLQFACQVSIVDPVMNVNAEAGRSLQYKNTIFLASSHVSDLYVDIKYLYIIPQVMCKNIYLLYFAIIFMFQCFVYRTHINTS